MEIYLSLFRMPHSKSGCFHTHSSPFSAYSGVEKFTKLHNSCVLPVLLALPDSQLFQPCPGDVSTLSENSGKIYHDLRRPATHERTNQLGPVSNVN